MARIRRESPQAEIAIAPMIDCVFLLLIYFIMTSSLRKQEADLSFQLPGVVEQSEPIEMPDEQWIEIQSDGQVVVNAYPLGKADSSDGLFPLVGMLTRFRETSDANQTEAAVTLVPAGDVPHEWVVRVMDACSKSGIERVNFSFGSEV
ncbi:MAG: biopolymer transporter ExbD [Opitutales bacterium]|nr:biopolymer transporter ExbD [Opitutales bacterium]